MQDGNTRSIARLYVDTLSDFFAGPRNIILHLAASKVPQARLLGQLSAIERYLDEAGKARLQEMRELVEAKSNLDFHYSQWRTAACLAFRAYPGNICPSGGHRRSCGVGIRVYGRVGRMIILQKFGFKESRYERPQDAWICGHLADGKPCELGPGLDGRCRLTTVCQPRLENDRWLCRRSANAGGPCQAGPLPDGQCCTTLERCVPHRSLRAKRRRGTLAAVALMVGILAVFLGGEGGRHFMMPGKLSAPHAGLTDCSPCHAGARSGQLDLVHRLFTAVEPRQNSNLCVTCHVMGADPFTPHTHPVEDLRRRTETLRLASKAGRPRA